MPVRKIPKSYRQVTGVLASRKAEGFAEFESTLERDFLAILEFSQDVEAFEVQPVRIEWHDERDINRSYIPDVLVRFQDGCGRPPWLCEVKYRADLKEHWAELRPKFRQAVRYAKSRQWRFRILTEKEIRTEYLRNVRFLAPFRQRPIPKESARCMLAVLQAMPTATPSRLLQAIASDPAIQAEWLPVLWHLLSHHKMGANLEKSLTMDSPIWSIS
ncbi:MAG: heteromeric transposase endonuclease subunit TnsA [Betaproteobacteria bacterium]|nr:heteromeric transposase endonuclease subunit TnsA [Betaproteobacteria bacterium]